MRVNYGQTVHGEEEIAAVAAVLRSSTQMDRHVRDMQDRVSALFSKRHGIMVNSGSSANFLAVALLDLPKGSEVITPRADLRHHGRAHPPARAGAGLRGRGDRHLQHRRGQDRGHDRPGHPREDGALADREPAGLAAPAPDRRRPRAEGDRGQRRHPGRHHRGDQHREWSDISTISFYGSHVINCAGNGGMLCVSDDAWVRRALLLRSWGRTSSLFVESEAIENRFNVDLDGIPYDAKFLFEELGYNMEPSEMGAAFGLGRLDRLQANISARVANFTRHLDFFAACKDWFILPRQPPHSVTGWPFR